MSETKFTPGPWRIVTSSDGFTSIASDKTVEMTGFIPTSYKDFVCSEVAKKADEWLIAAAPDLYVALETFMAWMAADASSPDYHGLTRDTHPHGEQIWRSWWDANLALCGEAQELGKLALSKARGEA